jgi:nitrate reductase assembly molybdenum cofactor insertion protein NarJ
VKRVQEKYECLLSEVKQWAERSEKRLEEKEKEWLEMFKSLYTLSKTGEIAHIKSILEETLSKQENSPDVSVP